MADNLFKPLRGQAADLQHQRFALKRGGIRAAGRRLSRLSSAFGMLALLLFVTIAPRNGGLVLSRSPKQSKKEASVTADHAGDARHRIRVVLQTDAAPGPDDVANLTFQATPLLDAPDLR
ncbi:MAG: hypothetical protein NZP34_06840, partial [Caldilineales bacterium]|nr:hypothetical protein [Caldilineales bacterium]